MEEIVDECLATLIADIDNTPFVLNSPTITEGGTIPATHTCDGTNQSPQLLWGPNPPAGTLSFAMVLTNTSNGLVHSVFYDIPSSLTGLPANVENSYAPPSVPGMHTTLAYDNVTRGWAGPCSPTTQSYEIAVYAINASTLPGSTMSTTRAAAVTSIMANSLGVTKLNAVYP